MTFYHFFIIFNLNKNVTFQFQNDDDQKHSFDVTGFFPIIHNLPLLELPSLAKSTESGIEVPIILLKKIVWADNSQARQTQHFVWSGRWGEEKNKAPVSSPLFWLFPRPLYDAIFWHVCLEQSNCHAIMFFWQCCLRSLSFISKCSRNKRKTKEMFKYVLGLRPTRLGKSLIY